ncbi:MAG: PQQ-binding-like beta-propeller repeat protein [Planctomycetaceae bacterium]|nr:PQQ-binding-like beta-propeller repeat protein [Planctomycetaceae bacterium]
MKRLLFLLSVTAVLVLPTSLPAGEWTRFRGPNGTGAASVAGIPTEFSAADFRFRTALPGGSGCGSPVVWGNRLFVLSADPATATRYFNCLDATSGAILWQKEFASEPHNLHTRSSYASCTPAVDEARVYVAWSTPKETVFKAFTHEGEEVWSQDLGRWQSQHGWGTSPIVYKDLVILHDSQQANQLKEGEQPGDSRMMAFDRRTGEQKWQHDLVSVNVCYSVPLIYSPEDGGPDELICCSTGNGFFSLDPLTGKENWSLNEGLFEMRTVSSPILAGGLLFGSTGSGAYSGNYVVAVQPGKNPKLVYKLKNSSEFKAPYVPCLIADGDLVFCLYDRGFASCINARSGEVVWINRTGAAFSGSPVKIDNRIFCVDEEGVVWVFAVDDEYHLLAKNELGEPSMSTPAIANNRIYFRTNGHIVCVGSK